MDESIDGLQDQIFVNPKESQLTALFELKRQLVMMRKLVTPQRDMVSTMMAQVVTIPGMTAERVADGVPHLRHRHRGAGRYHPVRHVPAARLARQRELSRRPGKADRSSHG